MSDRQTIENGADMMREECLEAELRLRRLNIRRYINLIKREHFINKIYFIVILLLVLGILVVGIKFSGRKVDVESHLEKVKINSLEVIREDMGESKVIVDFSTADGREYNFEFETPNDDKSINALSNIINDWNDDTKYIVLDYDIITRTYYDAFLDKTTTTKRVKINQSAAYLKQYVFQ